MSEPLVLTGLDGTNPLGFLTALGVIGVLTRSGREVGMEWTSDLVPHPIVVGIEAADDLIGALDADRERWLRSVVLTGPTSTPLDDVRPGPGVDSAWAVEVVKSLTDGRADADLFSGLLAEGAVDGKGNTKPTHLHFTAGQQRFLVMARELCERLDEVRLREAVFGPWRNDSVLPSLSWDVRGGRPYALRASDPSKVKRTSVPGADWLALLGLSSIPVRAVTSGFDGSISLETTGCDPRWKRSAFRWPLWSGPSNLDVIRSIVADPALVGTADERRRTRRRGITEPIYLRSRGVGRVMESPIRRTDQGGYGSFGGSVTIAQAAAT